MIITELETCPGKIVAHARRYTDKHIMLQAPAFVSREQLYEIGVAALQTCDMLATDTSEPPLTLTRAQVNTLLRKSRNAIAEMLESGAGANGQRAETLLAAAALVRQVDVTLHEGPLRTIPMPKDQPEIVQP